jgi:phosphoglycolate phosphatase
MRQMPDSLFFDLDGTLTNPRDGIIRCIRYALDGVRVAAPSDDELTRWIGPPLFDSFRDFFGHARHHLVTRAVSLYRKRYGTDGMLENLLYPGVSEGLRLLVDSGRP